MEQQSSKTKNVKKRCNLCEGNNHSRSLANQLRTDVDILKTGDGLKCDICRLSVGATVLREKLSW